MKNKENQVYCILCDKLLYEESNKNESNAITKVEDQQHQEIQVKDKTQAVQRKQPVYFNFEFALHQTVLQSLQTKLFFLSTLLNQQTDVSKITEILHAIKICLENIQLTINTFEINK